MLTKRFVLILTLLVSSVFIYNFYVTPLKTALNTKAAYYTAPSNNNIYDEFLFGAMNTASDEGNGYAKYDSLKMNLWHLYVDTDTMAGKHYPKTWLDANDRLFNPLNTYASALVGRINNVNDLSHTSTYLLHRPKIEYLCYGQRSDYQCEEINSNDPLWFYSFANNNTGHAYTGGDWTDNTTYGNNAEVKRCLTSSHSAGFVVDRLKANSEQSRGSMDKGINHWQGDFEHDWLIKPKIRIDSTEADNPLNLEKIVCKITVKNEAGSNLLTTHLRVRHFVDGFNNYDGRYLEEYNFESGDTTLTIRGAWGYKWLFESRGNLSENDAQNKADIQVYWYDNCDMWIDYVRVDNEIAHNLLTTDTTNQTHQLYKRWIQGEVDSLAELLNPMPIGFYIEYIEFNNIPALSYVNKKVKEYSDGELEVISDWYYRYGCHVPWVSKHTVLNATHITRFFIDSVGVSQFYAESYPFRSMGIDPPGTLNFSKIPNTLPIPDCPSPGACGIFADSVFPDVYDEWLQVNLSHTPHFYSSSSPWDEDELSWDRGGFTFVMKLGNEISKNKDIPFIHMPAAHSWYKPPVESQREPTNEELELQANLSVSYGVRGLIYFWYPSLSIEPGNQNYTRGIANPNGTLRVTNVYGQTATTKKQTMIDIGKRMKAWETTLLNFQYEYTNSYIYYDPTESSTLHSNSYFREIVSYKPGSGMPDCSEDFPDTTDNVQAPVSTVYECKEDRHLQAATFRGQSNDYNKYFMIVNRRCSPLHATSNDGERFIRLYFDRNADDFAGYNNWRIIDIETNLAVTTFDKSAANPYADLGWFNPGQGKLYKVVPVFRIGGTLIADENISNQTFTCLDTVIGNGFNITIDSGSTISFTDSACIQMTGGTFQSGVYGQNQLTTYKGAGSGKWPGLSFSGATVKIYNSKFQDISSPAVNYAVKMYNCPLGDIRTNQFVMSTDTSGAVRSNYVYTLGAGMLSGLYMSYNSVTMANSRGSAFAVQGYSGLTIPVYIANNTMSSNGYASGMLLSTVTGGMIKQNSITGFSTGINALGSTLDIFGNTISNTSGVSKGIMGTSESSLMLMPTGDTWLAGFNTIENTYGSSYNIYLDNSAPYLEDGMNTFDVNSSGTPPYHIYGTLSSSFNQKAYGNCFRLSNSDISDPNLPNEDLNGGNTNFGYDPYNCEPTLPGGEDIVDIGGGLYDTIPTSEGYGSNLLPLHKGETERGSLKTTTPSVRTIGAIGGHPSLVRRGVYTLTAAQLYDSVRINMAKRNYSAVKTYAEALLDNHASTYEALSSLRPLYLAVITTDTTSAGRTALKNYFAELILNNGSNTSLVKQCHYLSLKCMVLLGEYTSALNGFRQIMNNNPYGYEGLIAKWDYMATSLIAPGGGGVGQRPAFDQFEKSQTQAFDLQAYEFYGDDKNPFSKKQREDINTNIKTSFETTKEDNNTKIKTLEDRSDKGDETAKHELKQMRVLKDAIRSVKPKNMSEHINIVSSDVQKVFGNTAPIQEQKNTGVPREFSLSQNFPNPFNPTTTIRYALPLDVKVTIKIYDILGREVKQLVNEVQPAGFYDIKFDGSMYASGVYFYRIEAGEFVIAKKMVLVK